MSKWQLNGVAYEDLGWDLDEMSDLDGFIEWLVDGDDGAVWNEEEGYWEYPEDEDEDFDDWYDEDEDFDDDEDDDEEYIDYEDLVKMKDEIRKRQHEDEERYARVRKELQDWATELDKKLRDEE